MLEPHIFWLLVIVTMEPTLEILDNCNLTKIIEIVVLHCAQLYYNKTSPKTVLNLQQTERN